MGAGIVLARAEIRQDIENIRAAARWILLKWEMGGIKKNRGGTNPEGKLVQAAHPGLFQKVRIPKLSWGHPSGTLENTVERRFGIESGLKRNGC